MFPCVSVRKRMVVRERFRFISCDRREREIERERDRVFPCVSLRKRMVVRER